MKCKCGYTKTNADAIAHGGRLPSHCPACRRPDAATEGDALFKAHAERVRARQAKAEQNENVQFVMGAPVPAPQSDEEQVPPTERPNEPAKAPPVPESPPMHETEAAALRVIEEALRTL